MPFTAPEGIVVENCMISGSDQENVRIRIYKPETYAAPVPALLWLHGGGLIVGSPEMDDENCFRYAHELGIVVVSVGYRLAPEHPFPAALHDSYAALAWMASGGENLGIAPNRIAIGGASAGAGLAAALAQYAHDKGEIQPALQLLVYPMLDDRTALRTEPDFGPFLVWNNKSNRFGWESYLGDAFGADTVPAHAVPARRKDVSGLSPAWIGVGTADIFHDEDVTYASRLEKSGVDCELVVVEGAFHGFDAFGAQIPLVQDFRRSQIAALRKYLFSER